MAPKVARKANETIGSRPEVGKRRKFAPTANSCAITSVEMQTLIDHAAYLSSRVMITYADQVDEPRAEDEAREGEGELVGRALVRRAEYVLDLRLRRQQRLRLRLVRLWEPAARSKYW